MAGSPRLPSTLVRAAAPLALSLVLPLAIGSCGRGASVPDDGPIRIGVVMPQTGSLGTDGQEWLKGIRLATQEINAAGGPLPGRAIELVVLDSRTDSTVAVDQARAAVDPDNEADRVVAIIGDAGSGGTLAIYTNVTRDLGVPQVSCCATSPSLTAATTASPPTDRFFFRTAPSDALQGQVVARIADEDATCTRMAILHIDDAYGAPFAAAIQQEFSRLGGTVVATVPFVDERPSYMTEVQMIAAATPQCVALIAYPETAGTILRDYTRLTTPPDVTWIGTDGLQSQTFLDEVGAMLLSSITVLGAAPITQPMTPSYDGFAERHRAVFSTAPAPFVSNNYDAAALLFLAIARAQSTGGRAIMESVRSLASPSGTLVRAGDLSEALERLRAGGEINYEGASGSVDVDEFGDVRTDYQVWRVVPDGMRIDQVRTILAGTLR